MIPELYEELKAATRALGELTLFNPRVDALLARCREIEGRIVATPADDLAGVAAKLRLLVERTEDGGPVELARSALADIERLGAGSAPGPGRGPAGGGPSRRRSVRTDTKPAGPRGVDSV